MYKFSVFKVSKTHLTSGFAINMMAFIESYIYIYIHVDDFYNYFF